MKKIINFLLFGYLVLFPFGQLTRLPVKLEDFPEVNLYLTDLVVGFLGVIGGIRVIREIRERKYKLPVLAKPMVVFLGITAFSLLVNIPQLQGREVIVGALYWLRLLAY
ncbi:MAG: hypothetical protein ACPLXP_01965, partial [Microgenomates group bacterium]